jgi:two-component system chemotaxis response regulator CheY
MPVKVLLVDDSPTTRRAIRYQLMDYGCRNFSEAENGAQALELLRHQYHDLITLDLMMPSLTSIATEQVFKKIREEFPDAAILIISSIPYEKIKSEYLDAGAVAYIVKPFTRLSFHPALHKLRQLFEEFR